MKTIMTAAFAVIAVASAATSAIAGEPTGGHYEWRSAPQMGPRAPFQAPRRVWVPDQAQTARCDCTMMKMSAADCMKNMGAMRMSPSAG